jgi:hypothetical protein
MVSLKLSRALLSALILASLILTVTATILPQPVSADTGDYCNTQAVCGWCHSNWCPGGSGIQYYGNIKQCYHANGTRFSVESWCDGSPCGWGVCQ